MKTPRRSKLAASFVVTVSAMSAATTACGKRPTRERPESRDRPSYVARNGDECSMSVPESCPPEVTCNPPPPLRIDCPQSLRDAGDPPIADIARPPGKEDWLRVRPRLWASRQMCGYSPEYFCTAPPKPHACTPLGPPPALKCKAVAVLDAGADASHPSRAGGLERIAIEPFVYKDAVGACHAVAAFECEAGDCTAVMPKPTPTACP